MLRALRSPVQETAGGATKGDIAIAPLIVPIRAGPATIPSVILLEAWTALCAHRVVLLACVVLVDLASYIHLALGASDAKWMGPLAKKIMTRLMGLLSAALAVQYLFNGLTGKQGLLGRELQGSQMSSFGST